MMTLRKSIDRTSLYQTSLQAENHLISLKMSETDAKIENPTSEELKGVKRAADDDVEEIKKQKTENGSSNGKAAEVDAAENGDDVEEEEDIDEEDEENLGEEEEGEEGEEDLDEAEGEEGKGEEDLDEAEGEEGEGDD